MKKNKNILIHEIKKRIGKRFQFPIGTLMKLDYYDDYVTTALMYLEVKKDTLYLVSNTLEHGVETDKVSDFHTDYVGDIYNMVINENK